MMYLLVLALCSFLFIENRIYKDKQIHIHYLCAFLFSFISLEIFNTLLCVILVYWGITSLIRAKFFSLKSYLGPLTVLSVTLLVTSFFSFLNDPSHDISLFGLSVRNFVIMTFWPYMISYTITNLPQLKKLIYFYAVFRVFEVGIVGLTIYFFFYQEMWLLVNSLDLDVSMSDFNSPRLLSIGAPNSNDAAFVLLGALGLIVYRLFNKFRFTDVLLISIAFFSVFFTWTRSVWIFLLIYLGIIVWYNKKIKKEVIVFSCICLGIISVIAVNLYEVRKDNDDRLQTADNAYARQQQYIDYITAIPNIPIFFGVNGKPEVVAVKLGIRDAISPENYTLSIFLNNGILAGCLFVLIFFYFLVCFWLDAKRYIKNNKEKTDDCAFVVAVFATFVSMFLMAQTSLFRNNLILWIMIGFMSVIKKQIFIKKYEE